MTALSEHLDLLLQSISPTAKSTIWPPNLEQFEMKHVHRLASVASDKMTTPHGLSKIDLCPPNVKTISIYATAAMVHLLTEITDQLKENMQLHYSGTKSS